MEPRFLERDFTKHLVSVIIPTYNRDSLVKESIESVMAQTYRPIECIVVDDGSTDNTKEVVNELIKENTGSFTLKYIRQQNAGSQVARNTGTAAAKGAFIQYLDSDDLLYPGKIEKQVSFLNEHTNCDGVWSGWAKGTPQENVIIKSEAREDLLTQMLTEHCIHTLAFLMRRSIVEKIGPWDINIKRNQEIDFQVRGLLAGANFQHQPQIGGLWRIHEGERIASTTGAKEFLKFYQKWENQLTVRGLFNEKMKMNIAKIFIWLAQSNVKNNNEKLKLLRRAEKLNPHIPYFKTFKWKLLKSYLYLKTWGNKKD